MSTITSQDHVAMLVDNARGVGVIRREAHDRLATLARENIGGREALDFVLH
jgi:hypothetical protein